MGTMRGGKERPFLLRAAGVALVAGALLTAEDSGVAIAGGCGGSESFHNVKNTKDYNFSKVVFTCDGEKVRDPADSSVIRVTSKTKFLGVPFLWTTTQGAEEGLKSLQRACTLVGENLEPKEPKQIYPVMDVVIDDPSCTDKLS